jgi:hypothetical protein
MQSTDVRETAQQALDQSKSFLSKQVDERSTLLGEQIGAVGKDLRDVGDQMRQLGTGAAVAGYVDQGAELIEGLGQYLRDADSERLLGDLEGYARRQPWALAAGALVLGFAAARFLKTSSSRRYHASFEDGDGSTKYGGTVTYGETSYRDGSRADATRSGAENYAP